MNTTELLPHRFDIAMAAVNAVREKRAFFFSQYLLNPGATLDDVYFTLSRLLFLTLVRFVLAGAHHPRFRSIPSLFRILYRRKIKFKKESKFCENLWYACWHTLSFIVGFCVLWSEGLTSENPGWTRLLLRDRLDTRWYWFPTPAENQLLGNPGWPLFPMSYYVRHYYLTEMAFWLSCSFFLAIETKRHDFKALLLHHFVTTFLVFFSYICSYWRLGLVILFTHNFADIFLYAAKTVYYSRIAPLLVDFLFLLFVLSFFVSRLIMFPLFCLRPALDSTVWLRHSQHAISGHGDVPGGYALPAFLCILQLLHIFWFGLIIRMIIRTFRDKWISQQGDIRSDTEGDEESETENQVGRRSTASFDPQEKVSTVASLSAQASQGATAQTVRKDACLTRKRATNAPATEQD